LKVAGLCFGPALNAGHLLAKGRPRISADSRLKCLLPCR
jgi:hypothetical protein